MTDIHNKSFFGQKVGMIIFSSSKADPFMFLKFIKKKANGDWEKPSQGEGKSVKISLEEMINILNVLNKKMSVWKSFHSFKNEKTAISVKWDGKNNDLWINVGDYSKNLKFPQFEFLKLLLEHLIKEKIEFATSGRNSRDESTNIEEKSREEFEFFESESFFEEENSNRFESDKELTDNQAITEQNTNDSRQSARIIKARVKRTTGKAVLLCFADGKEVWFPKSTIHNKFDPSQNSYQQEIYVDGWILEKHSIH